MNQAGRILGVNPKYAVEGGEVVIDCEEFTVDPEGRHAVYISGEPCRIVAASRRRIVAIVPADVEGETVIHLESGGEGSEAAQLTVAKPLADDMHFVGNPAVDPNDGSIVLTRSGSRGQQLDHTLYRLELDGYLDELPVEVLNPTGVAFDADGDLYVTNRSEGEVIRIEGAEKA